MYKTEASFVKIITHSIEKDRVTFRQSQAENILIKKEMCLGYGIADIVVAKYLNTDRLERNNFLNLFDISLLRLIKKKKQIDIDKILDITKSSPAKVKASLKKLIADDIITTQKETFYSFKNYQSILTNSIAIEAKLKNWKRALNQAYRYKWFSEKSFVFLPEENISPALKQIALFKKMNVGLGTISRSKKINILFEPKKEQPYSEDMYMFLNECVLINLSATSEKIPKKTDDRKN